MPDAPDRLARQLDFLLELDKLKHVLRRTYLLDGSRHENDVEHSWHLAMMVVLLQEYAREPVDVLRTMKMVLSMTSWRSTWATSSSMTPKAKPPSPP